MNSQDPQLRRWASLLAPAVFALIAPYSAPAQACGGTFCDGAAPDPDLVPVNQSGEEILFVFDQDSVEAHIRIEYDPNTDAADFAWVIPVTALPAVEVGCDDLFSGLNQSSVVSYGYQTICGDGGDETGGGSSGGDGDGGSDSGSESGGGGVDVLFNDTVGAFTVAVLDAPDVLTLTTWLTDNGYANNPDAAPIFQEYLDENFLFVAIRLTRTADIGSIHPLVLRYAGNEPCVPIRLTRIAADPEMEITTYFLGDARVVPSTYKHVLVNPLKIDWPNFGQNYSEVISQAVDAAGANGLAFVTEFAGQHSFPWPLADPNWDPSAIAAVLTPQAGIDELVNQGLMACGWNEMLGADACTSLHLLLDGALVSVLPPPMGVTPGEFWGCLSCYQADIDLMLWDPIALAVDIQDRIVDPAIKADALVAQNPYLSRLYTRISPWEMVEDPIFYENQDLPDVQNVRTATRNICIPEPGYDGELWTLPDGREVYLEPGESWPEFPDEMPWEEVVEQALPAGPGQELFRRTELINELLAAHNAERGWPPAGGGSGDGTEGGTVGDGGTVDEGGTVADSGDGVNGSDGESAGCGCTSVPGLGGLALLSGLGLIRRPNRVRRP